jgi:hypothetical protein
MVNQPRCPAPHETASSRRVVGRTVLIGLWCLWAAGALRAQEPPVHYWVHGSAPPGAIGGLQLQRGGPLPGYFQPVEIKAPPGAMVSLAEEGEFREFHEAPVTVGLLIGQVYRVRVANLPHRPGMEVFPTVEVIDRLYAPPGHEVQFPIVVELTMEDLVFALEGKFVTRVIYLEDPQAALPVQQDAQGQSWFEIGPGKDPLAVADQLGRPVAILRLGARLPEAGAPSIDFLFGCPPFVTYPPSEEAPAPQAAPGAAPETAPSEPQPSEPPPARAAQQALHGTRR